MKTLSIMAKPSQKLIKARLTYFGYLWFTSKTWIFLQNRHCGFSNVVFIFNHVTVLLSIRDWSLNTDNQLWKSFHATHQTWIPGYIIKSKKKNFICIIQKKVPPWPCTFPAKINFSRKSKCARVGLFLTANADRRPWDSHCLNKGGREEEEGWGPLASSPGQGLASSTNC